MIEEILNKKDQEETNKIFNAIHKQAYWKNKEIENNRMLQNIEKELKKDKIKEWVKGVPSIKQVYLPTKA